MGYWSDNYGKSSQDFVEGLIAGITVFAVWDNGVQRVGSKRKPLREVIKEIKEEIGT